MNWQSALTTLAVLLIPSTIGLIVVAAAHEGKNRTVNRWVIAAVLATLITASLAAGLS